MELMRGMLAGIWYLGNSYIDAHGFQLMRSNKKSVEKLTLMAVTADMIKLTYEEAEKNSKPAEIIFFDLDNKKYEYHVKIERIEVSN